MLLNINEKIDLIIKIQYYLSFPHLYPLFYSPNLLLMQASKILQRALLSWQKMIYVENEKGLQVPNAPLLLIVLTINKD